jgi:hypothetical protein
MAGLCSIIKTTHGDTMKKVGDYLEINQEIFERFAWMPKRMSNDKCVWLKKYIEVRHSVDPFMLLTATPPDRYYGMYFTPADHTLYLLKKEK